MLNRCGMNRDLPINHEHEPKSETGTMSKTLDTDLDVLQIRYPLIRERMVTSGPLKSSPYLGRVP